MTLNVGTYYFKRHRGIWRVWLVKEIINGLTKSTPVKDLFTFEDALTETYRLNGWGLPKKIYRKY